MTRVFMLWEGAPRHTPALRLGGRSAVGQGRGRTRRVVARVEADALRCRFGRLGADDGNELEGIGEEPLIVSVGTSRGEPDGNARAFGEDDRFAPLFPSVGSWSVAASPRGDARANQGHPRDHRFEPSAGLERITHLCGCTPSSKRPRATPRRFNSFSAPSYVIPDATLLVVSAQTPTEGVAPSPSAIPACGEGPQGRTNDDQAAELASMYRRPSSTPSIASSACSSKLARATAPGQGWTGPRALASPTGSGLSIRGRCFWHISPRDACHRSSCGHWAGTATAWQE